MKLLRLKLNTPFRSLHAGFELHFLRDFDLHKKEEFNPYCLVGKNGSGKSNILEVLAAIFYHIECIYLDNTPRAFIGSEEKDDEIEDEQMYTSKEGFDASKSMPDAFELEYLIKKPGEKDFKHIIISKESNFVPIIICDEETLSKIEIKDVLPDYIVGYSSGHNEILSLPFFKMRFIHLNEYEDRVIQDTGYAKAEGRLIYLDQEFSQAILLSNFLFQDEQALQPLKETVNINDIKRFRIIINKDIRIPFNYNEETIEDDRYKYTSLISQESDTEGKEYYGALTKLERCATTKSYNQSTGMLILDYWVDDATKTAFKAHFYSPLELFQTFQTLLTLNLYSTDRTTVDELYHSDSIYVNETIAVLPSDQRIFRFKDFWLSKDESGIEVLLKSLSDGEHQYLHTIGMTLLYKGTSSLFLLDEPETHFNPKWRAQFISTLRSCLKDDAEAIVPEILITSHSPFIVSDSQKEHVLIFQKKDGEVQYTRPGFNTFGASVNKITMGIFEQTDTIGNYAKGVLTDLRKKLEDGAGKEELIEEVNRLLGDSVEKMLLVNSIIEKKS